MPTDDRPDGLSIDQREGEAHCRIPPSWTRSGVASVTKGSTRSSARARWAVLRAEAELLLPRSFADRYRTWSARRWEFQSSASPENAWRLLLSIASSGPTLKDVYEIYRFIDSPVP
jgi:hypothetical protein